MCIYMLNIIQLKSSTLNLEGVLYAILHCFVFMVSISSVDGEKDVHFWQKV